MVVNTFIGFRQFYERCNYRQFSVISFFLIFLTTEVLLYTFQKSIFYYQESNSLFIFSCDYLWKFLLRPGGLLEYSGLFLTQLYFSPFYGSLVVSVIILLTAMVFSGIQKQLSEDRTSTAILFIIPACLIMIMQGRSDHLMTYNLGFLATALWFQLSVRLVTKYKALIPGLFPLFYYAAGSFSLLFFAMYFIYRIVYGKGSSKYLNPVMLLLSALLSFIFFKKVLFLQPAGIMIFNPLNIYLERGFSFVFILLAFYVALFPLVIRLYSINLHSVSLKFQSVIVLIILSIPVFVLTRSSDPVMSDNLCLERLVRELDWNEVIRHHEDTPSESITGQYYYNLALAETGQLCGRMFTGRQDFGSGSLILHNDPPADNEIYFYYATGLINEAHHIAVESFVKNGYRPEIIKTLIRTDLIKRRYQEAMRFIDLLKRTLHYRRWAVVYERMLSDTSLISSDPDLGEKIRILPESDFFIKPVDSLNIESVLKSDPGNKIASEYKMARLLFEKELKTIAKEAAKMKENGYTYFPRHVGEAIVEAQYLNIDTTGISCDPSMLLRFNKYLEDYNAFHGDEASVFEERMKRKWGDTFWFYYDFK